MPRDYEIIIVDGEREFGNGYCLPAGPLREPISRLNQADIVISNGENDAYEYHYTSLSNTLVSLEDHSITKALEQFADVKVHAIAGIGNPKRFFATLENAGIVIVPHVFPDHYAYTQSEITFNDDLPIIMTEKDAVKCRKFNYDDAWFLPFIVEPNDRLKARITRLIEGLS
ncbi:MAG: tetraacyldisaccharide 4'-kinase [Gammaproteobacteria bacterium]